MEHEAPVAEHTLIGTSLEVEQLDTNLFRSKTLYVPRQARGVFGGQVISQALVSASNCVDSSYHLHSLHCYFLLSASPAVPMLYYVERLREGRTYSARSVKAVQNGHLVFTMLCSFQKPEPEQPLHYWNVPSDIGKPEDFLLTEESMEKRMNEDGTSEALKKVLAEVIRERKQSPIAIKEGKTFRNPSGVLTQTVWMKAKSIPKYDMSYQKCILSYMSDFRFIGGAGVELGLSRGNPHPKKLGMMSSLDHTVWFYNDNFHCGDWMLYVITCPAAASGRAVVHGQWYQNNVLVAACTQEGVVRAAKLREAKL